MEHCAKMDQSRWDENPNCVNHELFIKVEDRYWTRLINCAECSLGNIFRVSYILQLIYNLWDVAKY